jgi:hypothetical protein
MASKVFISYSDKNDTYADLRTQFVEDLAAADIDVWIDGADIGIGDAWLERITEGLGQCYAGIVLLSKDAIESDFVKYEVSCLLQRRRKHSGFKVFSLTLGNVNVDALKGGFYDSIRFLDDQIGPFDTRKAEVIDELTKLVPPDLTPMRELEDDLDKYFSQVSLPRLRKIAEDYHWDFGQGVGDRAQVLHFIRHLLVLPLKEQLKVLSSIKDGLPPGITVLELFSRMAPTWVDEQAALHLSRVREEKPGKRSALINGTHPEFTCMMFLRRAMPISETYFQEFGSLVPKGRKPIESLAKQIRDRLRIVCEVDVDPGSSVKKVEEAINEKLEIVEDIHKPVCALRIGAMDLYIIIGLQERFPRVTFVAVTPEEVVPEQGTPLEDQIAFVAPKLKTEKSETHHNEQYAHKWYELRFVALNESRPKTVTEGT